MAFLPRSSKSLVAVSLVAIATLCALVGLELTAQSESAARRVRVGYSPEPPFAFRSAAGRVTGEAPEVAIAVLRRAGIRQIDWVQTEFGLLIPELLAGRIDMIAAGMVISEERLRVVSFARPTVVVRESMLVKRGNPKSVHGFEDFRWRPELRLCVLNGAIEHSAALALRIPEDRIVLAPDPQTCIVALQSGSADALALSRPSIERAAASNKDLQVATPFRDPVLDGLEMRSFSAFAFRKSDVELRERVDSALEKFLATPEHLRLIAPFGFNKDDVPSGTAETVAASE